jgi:hypothetical protein
VIGGTGDNNSIGAGWVFVRNNSTWVEQQKLSANDFNYAAGFVYQGASIAISADGNTIAVGGSADNYHKGAVWIYIRNNNTWSQQGNKLTPSETTTSSHVGVAIALSADGNTLLAGGDGFNTSQGAAWIFTRNGGTWVEQQKLVGTGNIGAAQQGNSVAISADGNTAIVGGLTDNSKTGAIWIFVRNGSTWTQQGNKLVGSGTIGSSIYQGLATAISADGNTAVVGGYSDNSGQGAAWIFTRNGNTWSQQGNKLTGTGNIGYAQQGRAVAITADGNAVFIGGPMDNTVKGAAWIFTRNGGVWTQHSKIVPTDNVGYAKAFNSIAVCANANSIIGGGYLDNNNSGAGWVFVPSVTLPVSFTSLRAYEKNKGITVQWTLANETAVMHYEVQRSANGRNFITIGTQPKKNYSYSWVDTTSYAGKLLYRIKSVGLTGIIEYSSIVTLSRKGPVPDIKVYANLTGNSTVNLQLTNLNAGNYNIILLNDFGQTLMNKSIKHPGGTASEQLYIPSNVNKGMYWLKVTGNDISLVKQVIIVQ